MREENSVTKRLLKTYVRDFLDVRRRCGALLAFQFFITTVLSQFSLEGRFVVYNSTYKIRQFQKPPIKAVNWKKLYRATADYSGAWHGLVGKSEQTRKLFRLFELYCLKSFGDGRPVVCSCFYLTLRTISIIQRTHCSTDNSRKIWGDCKRLLIFAHSPIL